MKKQDTLPDFTNLCPPEQNPVRNYISLLIFFFFIAAVGGFLWEVLLFWIKEDAFHNRGFLYGPWLPVYGVGAVLFYLLLGPRPAQHTSASALNACKKNTKNRHPLTVFALSLLIGGALEFAIGWFLDSVWGLRYWDYRSFPLNFRGYVCVWSALGFGIAGMLWICILTRFLSELWLLVPEKIRSALLSLLLLLFLLDCAAALIFPNTGSGITF